MTTSARMWQISAETGGPAPTQRGATTAHVSLDTYQRDRTGSSPTMAPNAAVMSESLASRATLKTMNVLVIYWSVPLHKPNWRRTFTHNWGVITCVWVCVKRATTRLWECQACFLFHCTEEDKHVGGDFFFSLSRPFTPLPICCSAKPRSCASFAPEEQHILLMWFSKSIRACLQQGGICTIPGGEAYGWFKCRWIFRCVTCM